MKSKIILLIALVLTVSMSLTSCFVVALSALFLDVDESGELMLGDIDTGFKESEVQEMLGMTEKMLAFGHLEDGSYSVSIGLATEYVKIKIPAVHEGNVVTHIKCFRHGKFTSIIIPDGVTHIDTDAFLDASQLIDVYYTGTEEQWAQIVIGDGNDYLKNATIHFNSNPNGK